MGECEGFESEYFGSDKGGCLLVTLFAKTETTVEEANVLFMRLNVPFF